jgi:hypothetical protein
VLLVPIAKEVGSNLPGNHQNLLIFITGLICSTGMGMPVSGFPNQTAYVISVHPSSPTQLAFSFSFSGLRRRTSSACYTCPTSTS